MMPPLYAAKIRNHLEARRGHHDGWVPGGQVIDAICPDPDNRERAFQSLSLQARLGFIECRGLKNKRDYRFVKHPAIGSKGDTVARRLDASRARAERQAERQRRAEEKARQRDEARRRRVEARKKKAAEEAMAKRRKELRELSALARRHAALMAESKVERMAVKPPQTVDDFLARGGRIEILPPFQMSERLSR